MRHPERHEADGSERLFRFFDSSKGTMRGTFSVEAPTTTESRQVRRAKVRTAVFNRVTENAFNLSRTVRRFVARKARLAQ